MEPIGGIPSETALNPRWNRFETAREMALALAPPTRHGPLPSSLLSLWLSRIVAKYVSGKNLEHLKHLERISVKNPCLCGGGEGFLRRPLDWPLLLRGPHQQPTRPPCLHPPALWNGQICLLFHLPTHRYPLLPMRLAEQGCSTYHPPVAPFDTSEIAVASTRSPITTPLDPFKLPAGPFLFLGNR